MSHELSHVVSMTASCHTKCVISQIYWWVRHHAPHSTSTFTPVYWVMSHVCNKSCGKYEWVMSHKMWHATHVIQRGMRHATHSTSTTTLVHWVMSHVWTKSCGKYECVMSRTMWHVTIVTSHVTHTMSHVTHVTSHVIIQRVMTHKMWHVTDMTRSYGVATISRLLEMIGLFCKRAL